MLHGGKTRRCQRPPRSGRPKRVQPVAAGLDDFFAAVRDTNPFTANRVTEPSSYDVNVPAIHAASFDRLVDLAGKAMKSTRASAPPCSAARASARVTALPALPMGRRDVGQDRRAEGLLRLPAQHPRRPRASAPLPAQVRRQPAVGRGPGPLLPDALFRFVDRGIRHAIETAGVKADTIEDKFRQAIDAYRDYFVKPPEVSTVYDTLFQFWRYARPEKADDPARRPPRRVGDRLALGR